jgi:hypothetical protein
LSGLGLVTECSGDTLGGRRSTAGATIGLHRSPRWARNPTFTQEDPIGLAGGLNLYGFAGGDPINFWDPFGFDPCKRLRGEREEQECRERMKWLKERDDYADGLAMLQRCQVSAFVAAANIIGDVTLASAAVKVLGALVKAVALGRVAANLATEPLVRGLAPAAVVERQAAVSVAVGTGTSAVAGDVGNSVAANGVAVVGAGSSISGWDFVPVVSTARAVTSAKQACGG